MMTTKSSDRTFFLPVAHPIKTQSPDKIDSKKRYLTLVAAGLTLGIGLKAAPDSRLTTWARGEAAKELGE